MPSDATGIEMARATTKTVIGSAGRAAEKAAEKLQARRMQLVEEFTDEARRFSQLSDDIAPAGQGAAAYAQLTVSALLFRVGHALEHARILPESETLLGVLVDKAATEMQVDSGQAIPAEIIHTATAASERAFGMAERRLTLPPSKMRLWRAPAAR